MIAVLPDVNDTAGSSEDRMRRYWAAAAEAIAANIPYFNLEIDLVRLSHEDADLARVLPGARAVAEHGLALMIEPSARDVGAREPEPLAARLAPLTVTFTRGRSSALALTWRGCGRTSMTFISWSTRP
ncbi:MAG: hypothetical protein ACRDP7_04980 [Trebonia sp.]